MDAQKQFAIWMDTPAEMVEKIYARAGNIFNAGFAKREKFANA